MVSIFGTDLGVSIPSLSGNFSYWFTVMALITLFTVIAGFLIFMWWTKRVFNKKIVIFENISGAGWQNTGNDRARIIKIGDGGEEIMYLMKKKVYRTAYGRKMGQNTYWFAIGQDGYWYNVVLGDLDAKMGMLDIEPIDRDMRYMHVAIRKNIQERYRRQNFLEKYGVVLFTGLFFIILAIALWFLVGEIKEAMEIGTSVVSSVQPVAESLNAAVGRLDAICGGTGIRPA